jgi:hypothetical protein
MNGHNNIHHIHWGNLLSYMRTESGMSIYHIIYINLVGN